MDNDMNHIYQEEEPTLFEQLELRRALIKSQIEMPDVEEEWKHFSQTLDEESGEVVVASSRKRLWMWVSGVAAAVVLLVLLSLPWEKSSSSVEVFSAKTDAKDVVVSSDDGEVRVVKNQKTLAFAPVATKTIFRTIRMMEVATPRGKDCQLTLPDGTHVWLNADSKISFPEEFTGKERKVTVLGEAYFEVVKDVERPFVVQTDYFTTTVHGTVFNLRAYSVEDASVALVSGSVAVKPVDGAEQFIVPGQMASVSADNELSVRNVDIYPLVQWKDGFFYFESERLVDIMMELGRWYNVNIVFEHEEDMNRRLHFVAERKDSLRDVIRRLNNLGIVKIKLDKDNVSIE